MRTLYQIEQEYQQIAEQIIESGGELTEGMENALIINREELQEKATNYAYVIKDIENDIEGVEREIKRLQALKKAREGAKERLSQAISGAMELYGVEKIELPCLKLSFLKSESVEITDESLIPEFLKEKVVTEKISKVELKKILKSGTDVNGAKLVVHANLQIK